MSPLLDLRDVARDLGVTPAALRAWARRGQFPCIIKLSARNYRVDADKLAQWLRAREVKPDAPPPGLVDAMRKSRPLGA